MLILVFYGVVQGVGFRPSIYRIIYELNAHNHHIYGGIYNHNDTAILLSNLTYALPPAQKIKGSFVRFMPFCPSTDSHIDSSVLAFVESNMLPQAQAHYSNTQTHHTHSSKQSHFPRHARAIDSTRSINSSTRISINATLTDTRLLMFMEKLLSTYFATHATTPTRSRHHAPSHALQLAPHTRIACIAYATPSPHIATLLTSAPYISLWQSFSILSSNTTTHSSSVATSLSPHTSSPISLPTLPPDVATCATCQEELRSKHSRFFHYHLSACTHCGARYSMIRALPYDRERTSMADFPLCKDCARDYANPLSRFYHAQPLSCWHCAVPLRLLDATNGAVIERDYDSVQACVTLLESGEIVCIKGLGGFAFICDSTNTKAIQTLRVRKHRAHKPFALMCKDIAQAQEIATLSPQEIAALSSPSAPIILATQSPSNPLSLALDSIAPELTTIGIMLANTPLHHLLLSLFHKPIIYTSANQSGEPILTDITQAMREVDSIARYFLDYGREIMRGLDDSIYRYIDGAMRPIRLARGATPRSLYPTAYTTAHTPSQTSTQKTDSIHKSTQTDSAHSIILAIGADEKITPTLLHTPHTPAISDQMQHTAHASTIVTTSHIALHTTSATSILSSAPSPVTTTTPHIILLPYIGNLKSPNAIARLESHLNLYPSPTLIISDAHPNYHSTQYATALAEQRHITHKRVYHHHAHHCAILYEMAQGGTEQILSIIWDGSGFGSDGSIWGGEFFYGDMRACERVGSFAPFALLGGQKAIYDIERIAYILLLRAQHTTLLQRYNAIIPQALQHIARTLESSADSRADYNVDSSLDSTSLARSPSKHTQGIYTSSVGRLFDGVAHILGLLNRTSYEGQAGALLESLAYSALESLVDSSQKAHLQELLHTPYPYRIHTTTHNIAIHNATTAESSADMRADSQVRVDSSSVDSSPQITPRFVVAWEQMIYALSEDLIQGVSKAIIAYRFHYTLADMACAIITRLIHTNAQTNTRTLAQATIRVGISGGVFQNKLLCELLAHKLRQANIDYAFHTIVPCNDGGIALGQAMYGLYMQH